MYSTARLLLHVTADTNNGNSVTFRKFLSQSLKLHQFLDFILAGPLCPGVSFYTQMYMYMCMHFSFTFHHQE